METDLGQQQPEAVSKPSVECSLEARCGEAVVDRLDLDHVELNARRHAELQVLALAGGSVPERGGVAV